MASDLIRVFDGIGSVGALYLSDFNTKSNLRLLEKHNIRAIISAEKGKRLINENTIIERYLQFQIQDHQDFPIDKYFNRVYDFIQNARKHSNVLISSDKDINISATLVMAFLIRKYHYSLAQVHAIIRSKLRNFELNSGFLKKLERYSLKYRIHEMQVCFDKNTQKGGMKLWNSLNLSFIQEVKEQSVNQKMIKSDLLQENRRNNDIQLFEEQDGSKLRRLRKQRQEIEQKLRNFRNGLFKGGNIRKGVILNQYVRKVDKKRQQFSKNREVLYSQNINPNLIQSDVQKDQKTKSYVSKIKSKIYQIGKQ